MVFERIQKLICEQFVVDPETVTMDTAFVDDLGADSLDVVELTMALEEPLLACNLAKASVRASTKACGSAAL